MAKNCPRRIVTCEAPVRLRENGICPALVRIGTFSWIPSVARLIVSYSCVSTVENCGIAPVCCAKENEHSNATMTKTNVARLRYPLNSRTDKTLGRDKYSEPRSVMETSSLNVADSGSIKNRLCITDVIRTAIVQANLSDHATSLTSGGSSFSIGGTLTICEPWDDPVRCLRHKLQSEPCGCQREFGMSRNNHSPE